MTLASIPSTQDAYDELKPLDRDAFVARVKAEGCPCDTAFAEAVWHALSGNKRAVFGPAVAADIYAELGYVPFSGFPLKRDPPQRIPDSQFPLSERTFIAQCNAGGFVLDFFADDAHRPGEYVGYTKNTVTPVMTVKYFQGQFHDTGNVRLTGTPEQEHT